MLRFTALALVLGAAFLAIGVVVTRDGGAGGREPMLWACLVAFVGALLGAVPLTVATPEMPRSSSVVGPAAVSRFMAAMIVRMIAVGLGAAAVVFVSSVEAKPFLLWLAAGYLAFLILETAFALRLFRSL